MRKIGITVCALLLVTTLAGCAYNEVAGNGVVRSDQYFGDVGITGNGSQVAIAAGSRVTKLSIIGHNNTVTVQDGASLYRMEFWGKGNTVSIPDFMAVRTTEVGNNQIIRRPRAADEGTDYGTLQPPPGESAPTVTNPPPTETGGTND